MNQNNRITEHPVLNIESSESITFYWDRKPLKAKRGEMIASALIANGVHVFSRHHRDGSAQGIFCANGQCAKCMVIANGVPVKSCMTTVQENMIVEIADGLPDLPGDVPRVKLNDIQDHETEVLIIGGGPAGLSAALELGKLGIRCLLVDDKHKLGGKLVLQTHKFFGSVEDSHAGTRGIDIGDLLADQVEADPNLTVWTGSTVLYVFKDKKVGILKEGVYHMVTPHVVLNTAGAREKFLRFHGNTLPGVYGAGAFQTLVNRDLVRSSQRLFIVGGGNVGLIAGYHALQAGIEVVGLAEAMPRCGGYKVHADKLVRLGVPIYTRHTVLSANGSEHIESVTIAEVDKSFTPIPGTEKTFACDTLLIAVGLESIDEFTEEARSAGLPVYSAGDAQEIAEASSAMFNGRIMGMKLAADLGKNVGDIPSSWYDKAEILKAHPGKIVAQNIPENKEGVLPVIHCLQEIPCNPCSTICPTQSIKLSGDPIMGIPEYQGKCTGCGMCVAICPGLAITLVDYRKDSENPTVTVPYELSNHPIKEGDRVPCVNIDGDELGEFEIVKIRQHKKTKTHLVGIKVPEADAKKVVSFRIQNQTVTQPLAEPVIPVGKDDDIMVCLCERVTAGEVRSLVKKGVHDINMIKAITRAGMGPCGSKNCDNMIRQIFRQEGVPVTEIIGGTRRPVFIEIPLGKFADGAGGNEPIGSQQSQNNDGGSSDE